MSLSKENKKKMEIIIGDNNNSVSPETRLKEMASIRIYDDEKVYKQLDKIEQMIKTVWKKEDIIIKQLTVIGRIVERKKR